MDDVLPKQIKIYDQIMVEIIVFSPHDTRCQFNILYWNETT